MSKLTIIYQLILLATLLQNHSSYQSITTENEKFSNEIQSEVASNFDIMQTRLVNSLLKDSNAGSLQKRSLRFDPSKAMIYEDMSMLNLITRKNFLHHLRPDSDAVIVLGFPDSGKDILVQLLTGHDDKLKSIKSSQSPETFTIHNDFASSSIYREIYPKLIKDPNNTMSFYWEFPGLVLPQVVEDSEIEKIVWFDIISRFFESKVLESARRLKLVYAFNYQSVKSRDSKAEFTLLNLIKAYDKFENSVALVLTDVYDYENVEKVKKNVADSFREILKTLPVDSKYNETKVSFEKKYLVHGYPLIGILSRPTKPGKLTNLPSFGSEKDSLIKLIVDDTTYAERNKSDFFLSSLQPRSLNKIKTLVDPVEQNLEFFIEQFFNKVRQYFASLNEATNDIFKLRNQISKAYKTLSAVTNCHVECENSEVLTNLVLQKMKELSASISNEPANYVQKYNKVYQFFEAVLKRNNDSVHTILQQKQLNDTINYLKDLEIGYNMLIEILNQDSDIIEIHRNGVDIKNLWFQEDALREAATFIYDKTEDEFLFKIYEKLFTSPTREVLEKKLDLILTYITENTSIEYETSNRMIVRGNYVFLSEVPQLESGGTIKVYAREKFYVDADYSAVDTHLYIVAPEWIVMDDYKIVLKGKDGEIIFERAKDGKTNGISPNGEHGLQGNAGSPGGNFIGISDVITGDKNLYILSLGGDGGPGQTGGNGADGNDESDESILSLSDRQFCNNEFTGCYDLGVLRGRSWIYKQCILYKPCNNGGNGGNGGLPGQPGPGGDVIVETLTELSDVYDVIDTYSSWGIFGRPGKAGSKGKASRPGLYKDVKCIKTLDIFWRSYEEEVVENKRLFCQDGQHGVSPPLSSQDASGLRRNVVFDTPFFKIVNEFRVHARNESTGVRDSFLQDFIEKIDGNSIVRSLSVDPALAFTTEFLDLEKQFNLTKPALFFEYYIHLRDRIDSFVQEKSLVGDEKIVFNFLGAALLSKIRRITLFPDDDLIVDLKKEFDTTIKYIQFYDEQRYQIISQEIFDDYNKTFNDKIKETQSFISGEVDKDLDETYKKIDEETKMLIDEIVELRDLTPKEKKKLEVKQRNLSEKLEFRKLLGVVKFVSLVAGFFTPVGAAVGAAIGGGATILETTLLNDNSESEGKISSLPLAVQESVTNIKSEYERRKNMFNDNLELTKQKLKEIESTEPAVKETREEMEKKIKSVQEELKITETTNMKTSWVYNNNLDNRVDEKRKELARYYKEKIDLMKKAPHDRDINIKIGLVTKASNLVSLSDVGIGSYMDSKHDALAVDKVLGSVEIKKNEIEDLEILESDIRDNFTETIARMKDDLDSRKHDLSGKSFGALHPLDVSRWRVQEMIREIGLKVSEKTKAFKVYGAFHETINKLERAMSLTIKLYDQIEKYRDEVAQAKFFKDMMQTHETDVEKIVNKELRDKVGKLKLTALSNVIRKRYESDFEAFRQYVFPNVEYFQSDFKLFEQNFVDVGNPTLEAKDKIQNMIIKLEEYDAHSTPFDVAVFSEITFDDPLVDAQPAFYKWEHDTLERYLPDLLSGEEVTLYADITRALPNKDAVKFNYVDLRLKLTSASVEKQREFDDIFRQYSVNAVHFGDSRYKCCGKYYSMTTPAQNMTFTIRKNVLRDSESPAGSNQVYKKLKKHAALLSPYATWSFTLIPPEYSSNLNFKTLTNFLDYQMELELIGKGSYVNENSVCNNDLLSRFYKSIVLP